MEREGKSDGVKRDGGRGRSRKKRGGRSLDENGLGLSSSMKLFSWESHHFSVAQIEGYFKQSNSAAVSYAVFIKSSDVRRHNMCQFRLTPVHPDIVLKHDNTDQQSSGHEPAGDFINGRATITAVVHVLGRYLDLQPHPFQGLKSRSVVAGAKKGDGLTDGALPLPLGVKGVDPNLASSQSARDDFIQPHSAEQRVVKPSQPPLYNQQKNSLADINGVLQLLPLTAFPLTSTSASCVEGGARGGKSPGKPLAELDHRDPAVHSQGPLLLLAARRPTPRGEKEWVAGGGGGGARAGGSTCSMGSINATKCMKVKVHSATRNSHVDGELGKAHRNESGRERERELVARKRMIGNREMRYFVIIAPGDWA
ncbi:hypothetical protein EYF80_011558 [Liparis tanakae]|uniref:Uncharacterized protein n=1 Tax=Liparis tanakae TaxID=230148 RepID=A0A4Z2IKQ3_9TELE|nr:hypothetical protein EYF80_011558 [Liparis tanakae]